MSDYLERVAKGNCGKCNKPREDGNTGSLCLACRERERQRAIKKRERNITKGGCINCGKPTDGGIKCDGCKAAGAASRKRTVQQRKAAGLCVGCGQPIKPGCTMCQPCIDSRSQLATEHYHRRRAAGLCSLCNKPTLDGFAFCQTHLEYTRDVRLRLKQAAFDAYGGPTCSECGLTDIDVLTIDHIDGGGSQHRIELGGGGTAIYTWLKTNDYPPGFRILCHNCNWKSHINKQREANIPT